MKRFFGLLLCLASLNGLFAQTEGIGINSTGNNPDSSAMLDVQSINKGFLMPRMTTGERNAIKNPTAGLYIFNLTDSCFNYYTGSVWVKDCGHRLDESPAPAISQNASGYAQTHFIENGPDHSLYLIGNFSDQLTLGDSTLTQLGQNSYVAKYDPQTNEYLWVKVLETGSFDVKDVSSDGTGNFYITGRINNGMSLMGTPLSSSASQSCYIAKIDPYGNLSWIFKPNGYNYISAIEANEVGQVFFAGTYQGTTDFGGTSLTATANYDGMLGRLTQLGTLDFVNGGYVLAVVSLVGPGFTDMELDAQGNIYLSGVNTGTTVIGTDTLELPAGQLNQEGFVTKLDPSLTPIWTQSLGSPDNSLTWAIKIDEGGNSYVTGTFGFSMEVGGVSYTATTSNSKFLIKLDPSGGVSWGKVFGNTAISRLTVEVKNQESLFLLGSIFEPISLGSQTLYPSSPNRRDVIAVQYDADGKMGWIAQSAGSLDEVFLDAVYSPAGNLYVTGFFNSSPATFGGQQMNKTGLFSGFLWPIDGATGMDGTTGQNSLGDSQDNDRDPSNELQSLSLSGTTLSLSDGNSVSLPTDGDGDPTNEIELPTGGNNGQLLQTDGSGNYAWVTADPGGVIQGTDSNTLNLRASNEGIFTVGDPRGENSVDFQTKRTFGTQVASGDFSIILGGRGNTASGDFAAVMSGYTNRAFGLNSFIGGGSTHRVDAEAGTIAGGNANVVDQRYGFIGGGLANYAGGQYSSVPGGLDVSAYSYGETAIGIYTEPYTALSETAFEPLDRLFVVGNGTFSNRSNALTLLKNGNLGLGTSSPDTTLHVIGQMRYEDGNQQNGYVLTSDVDGVATWQAPIDNSVWSITNSPNSTIYNIGGNHTLTSGVHSLVTGENNEVDADNALIVGNNNRVLDNQSAVIGFNHLIGPFALNSFASGNSDTLQGGSSVAIGTNNYGGSSFNVLFGGSNHIADGIAPYSVAIGKANVVLNGESVAIGANLEASTFRETIFGSFNEPYTPISPSFWDGRDRLFSIGNGLNSGSRSNALTLLKNGNLGLGTTTPDTTLHVVGQMRYEDGNQQAGYVLTSDANGIASWRSVGIVQGTNGQLLNLRVGNEGPIPGNNRGAYSIDLQTGRSNASQVASQSFSSILGGYGNTASGSVSTVAGGSLNEAAANGTTVSGGSTNQSTGQGASIGGGLSNTASGHFATIPGGEGLQADSYAETVVGRFNLPSGGTAGSWVGNEPLFIVGIGTDNNSRSNAMTILKNGRIGIGTPAPQNNLDIEGGLAIGTAYSGTSTAPTNGVIIEGTVGIGTDTPTRAKLEISGSTSFDPGVIGYLNASGATGSYNPNAFPYSIYASNVISGQEFHAHSDRRIKHIQGISNSQTDLSTLMQIEVTDYRLRDSLTKGNRPIKKVIAQQVAEVYPQAVTNKLTEVVPDIYQRAEVQDGWIMLATDLQVGERVKLITVNSSEVYEVLEAEPSRFKVSMRSSDIPAIFVYGREVDDFHTVDYEALSMLNVSATQAQQQIIEAQQAEIQHQRTQIKSLQSQLNALKSLQSEQNRVLEELAALKAMFSSHPTP